MTPSSHHVRVHLSPEFGYDPWIGPGQKPTQLADGSWMFEHQGHRLLHAPDGSIHHVYTELPFTADLATELDVAPVYTEEDTIGADIGLLSNDCNVYGSYTDNFGGYPELVARFGADAAKFLISFTIFGGRALCADVQSGAMKNEDFPRWLLETALKDILGYSWEYTNAGNMAALIAANQGHFFIRFSAHFGHGPHICGPSTCGFPQAHWTQWDDKGANGENVDRGLGTYLPIAKPKPKPPNPHYDWYTSRQARRVKQYDEYRRQQTRTKHPHRVALAKLRVELAAMALAVLAAEKVHKRASNVKNRRVWRHRQMYLRSKGGRFPFPVDKKK